MGRRENWVLPVLTLPNRSLSYTKIMQTSGKRACSLFPECRLSYTKIMQGECNGKTGKLSFTVLDIAEPKLILYKDNANERKESLLFVSRVPLILYKDTIIFILSPEKTSFLIRKPVLWHPPPYL